VERGNEEIKKKKEGCNKGAPPVYVNFPYFFLVMASEGEGMVKKEAMRLTMCC